MTASVTFALILGLLIKSGAVAAVGLTAARWVARRPSDRGEILRATLVLLLALPLVAAFAPALRLDILPMPAADVARGEPLWSGTAGPVAGVAISGDILWPSPVVILAWVWAVGALGILGRLLVGVWTLRRWTREAEVVRCPTWARSLERLAARRPPVLLSSPRVRGPLSWGLPPGVIVIDTVSLAAPDTAPAILAHELAHVQRHDWAFLMLSRLVLAVFWFNPLVWKLHADLAAASEDAADAEAVRHVDRSVYARALIGLASDPRSTIPRNTVALAMAADPRTLKRRISRVMTQAHSRRRPLAIGLTIAGLVAVATPLAALELHSQAPTPPSPPTAPAFVASALPPAPPAVPRVPMPTTVAMPWVALQEPPAPPAPPAPPEIAAPPAPPMNSRYAVVIENGVTREATPEERAVAEQARAHAREARVVAEQHRVSAAQARVHAEGARRQADQARTTALQAREQAMRARVDARAQMRVGADQMREGAVQMRREAARFSDPAHRAEVIERARERGQTLTDAHLRLLGPRLMAQADVLEQRASRLAGKAVASN